MSEYAAMAERLAAIWFQPARLIAVIAPMLASMPIKLAP
jgi:hypothetical protein